MRRIQFVPGAIGAGNNITIPTAAPDIDTVLFAEITRLPLALGVGDHPAGNVANSFGNHTQAQVVACFQNHTQAQIVAAFADHGMVAVAQGVGNHTEAQVAACIAAHPDHAHDLGVIVGVVLAGEEYGAAGAGGDSLQATGGPQTILGGNPATGGVMDNAAAQAHVASGTDLAHQNGVNVDHVADEDVPHIGVGDLAHVAGAVLAHGAAANPVVAVVAVVRETTRIVTFTAVAILDGDLVTLVYEEVGQRVLVS